MKSEIRSTSGNDCVRVIKRLDDPFAGLKGHEYIKARNLAPQVKRVQTSACSAPAVTQEVRK